VIGTATSASGAEQISQALQQNQIKGAGMALDVNDAAQIDQLLKSVAEQFGDVSILVNNAGITRDTLLMRMKDEDWDAVIGTNLKSVYRMSQAVIRPMMKARSGRIINISSVVGHMGNAGQTNYAAAKAGMTGFSKSVPVAAHPARPARPGRRDRRRRRFPGITRSRLYHRRNLARERWYVDGLMCRKQVHLRFLNSSGLLLECLEFYKLEYFKGVFRCLTSNNALKKSLLSNWVLMRLM